MRLVAAIRDINGMINVQGVGDDWQAINGFAGSDLVYFSDASNQLDEPVLLDLLRNRRSGSEIVTWGKPGNAGGRLPGCPGNPGSGQRDRFGGS